MPTLSLKRRVEDLKRFRQILKVFFKRGFKYQITKLGFEEKIPFYKRALDEKSKSYLSKPRQVRLAFEELGGAFIKFGQLMSLRPDLIPAEYCEELAKLQDTVSPIPFETVKRIIEGDTGKSVKKLFSSFTRKPLAAGSIAQVHRATLTTGEHVVVKIRRPDVERIFETDVDIFAYLSQVIEKKFQPKLFRPQEIVKEFRRYTRDELDFKNEAKNIHKFANNFSKSKSIVVPKIFDEYTTENLLVIEFIDGIKITDIKALKKKRYSRKEILTNLIDCLFKQVFTFGIFHADPHPGNILVVPGNKIAFLDFGIVGHMTESLREKIAMMFISLINGDVDGVADGMLDLGLTTNTEFDKEMFKQDLIDNLARYYDSTDLSNMKVGQIFNASVSVARDHKITLPSNLVLLLKAIVTLEGVGELLDNRFNLVTYSRPIIRSFIKQELSIDNIGTNLFKKARQFKRLVTVLPEQTYEFLSKLNRGEFHVEFEHRDLENLIFEMERTSDKIVLGVILASLLIGSSLALSLDLPQIYGLPYPAFFGFLLSGILTLVLLRLMIR